MRLCTDEDYDKFYPPDERSVDFISLIRNKPDRDMLCLDLEAGVELYGAESSNTYAELDLVVMPCNVRLVPLGATDDRIGPECEANLSE